MLPLLKADVLLVQKGDLQPGYAHDTYCGMVTGRGRMIVICHLDQRHAWGTAKGGAGWALRPGTQGHFLVAEVHMPQRNAAVKSVWVIGTA